jgi:hypothetical protein
MSKTLDGSIVSPAEKSKGRTERLRAFVVADGSAEPVPGVPVSIVANLTDSNKGETLTVPLAILESDRRGYLSVKLGDIVNDERLSQIWLYPYNSPDLGVDAFPVIDAKTGPALVTLMLPQERIPILYGGTRFPSIPDPDVDDWRISPGSFSIDEPLVLGEPGCEEMLHSREAERSFRFVQLVRDGNDSEIFDQAPFPDPELGDVPKHITVRRGAMLEYEITWTPLGHGLGRVVYSLPLAPCESVKVAVIDWGRQDEVARYEDMSVSEQFQHNQRRDRTIEEIVHVSLTEKQRGGSFMAGLGAAISGSFGAWSVGGTGSHGGAFSATRGSRRLAADTTQKLVDSMAQNASALRRLNSTVVVQASQAEQEVLQTRTVANHNHCHALNILYYEVVRHYLVAVRLINKQDVVFVKYGAINAFQPNNSPEFTVETALRYRRILEMALLDESLSPCFDAIENLFCEQQAFGRRPLDIPVEDYELETIEARFTTGAEALESSTSGEHFVRARLVTAEPASRTIPLLREGEYVWGRREHGGTPVEPGKLGGYSKEEAGEAGATPAFGANQEDIFTLRPSDPIRWANIDAIMVEASGPLELAHLQMRTRHGDHIWTMFDGEVADAHRVEEPLPEGWLALSNCWIFPVTELGPATPEDTLSSDEYCCIQRLLNHLNDNKVYYSRILWLTQDPEERAKFFEPYAFSHPEGEEVGRLTDFIENRIVGVSGNYVAFPLTVTVFANELNTEVEKESERVITLPTRGVFAESKLSHCNACEVRDVTRYWDWTESPCPEEPPEISAIEPGGRAGEIPETKPSSLPSPIINIVSPGSAPEPGGLASALELLATSDIFRDMSASEELSGLLQELAKGAAGLAAPGAARGLHDRSIVAERLIEQGRESGALSSDEANDLYRQLIERVVTALAESGTGEEDESTEDSDGPEDGGGDDE